MPTGGIGGKSTLINNKNPLPITVYKYIFATRNLKKIS